MIHYTDPVPPTHLPLEIDGPEEHYEDGPLQMSRSILPGGIRVLTENVPGTRSATIGLWVPVGSRDETHAQGGAAHFLEHLLFKGTRNRSALDLATAFDEVGGESNAATAKESTHYWARVLDDDIPMAVDTLTDMVSSSLLREEDIETERGVILDELAMAEDSPAEVAQEAFFRAIYGDTPVGRPIGGSPESVRATSPEQIRSLYSNHYGPTRLIVTAAGNVSHDAICQMVDKALDESNWNRQSADSPSPRRGDSMATETDFLGSVYEDRDIEQAHILVGGEWLKANDSLRPVSTVLTTILGGGMSSRLFQEIREKRGLAYTTYAFDMSFSDTGVFGMYAGCAPENITEVEKIMWGEVERLAEGDLSESELIRAKGQLRGGIALGMEDSASRMSRLGRSELTGRFVSIDGALARIEAVCKEDLMQLASDALSIRRAKAVVSPSE
ncbi:M16 family metallopeptidase [Scrofimicrobium canadense]|nr:pitrilysin family protein [Scrofimicrobium canadense]